MDYQRARQAMIDSQIRTGNVTDEQIIAAFSEIPRELFVPPHNRALAYCDREIEVSQDRYLMEPMILARLIQALGVNKNKMILVLGAGTGYAAAILSKIAGTVVALDSNRNLLRQAEEIFKQLQMETIVTVEGALQEGFPRHAPYDGILLDGATEIIPQSWLDQLGQGGRLAAIINEKNIGKASLIEKANRHSSHKKIFNAWVPVVPELKKNEAFVFA